MARYEVLGRVATTRSGAVWKARDTSLDRLVALKELPGAAAADEAATLARLNSPHVVQVYEVVEDGARTFLVEEWIEGATLAAILRQSGALNRGQALAVVRGALLGLADTHRAGLVHGDISMTNVLVGADGESRLIDFGSVVRAGGAASVSTEAFAAPETRAGGAVTPASDVYSAATVLAGLLQGRAASAPSTRGIETGVKDVLDTALDADPSRRYADAAAFLAALEAAAERSYGAAWWTQAGLGALAAAGGGAVVVPDANAPFSGQGTVAAAAPRVAGVAAAVATDGSTSTIGRPVGRSSRRLWIGVGAGILVAAIGAVVAVAATSGDDKKRDAAAGPSSTSISTVPSAPATTSTTTSTSTPPPSIPPDKAFAGAYRVRQVVVSTAGLGSNLADSRVGNVTTRKWNVTSSCSGATCTAHVHITGGSVPNLTLHRTATGWAGTASFTGDCLDNSTGAVLNTMHRTLSYEINAPASAVVPSRFTGKIVDTAPPTGACKAVRVVKSITVVRA